MVQATARAVAVTPEISWGVGLRAGDSDLRDAVRSACDEGTLGAMIEHSGTPPWATILAQVIPMLNSAYLCIVGPSCDLRDGWLASMYAFAGRQPQPAVQGPTIQERCPDYYWVAAARQPWFSPELARKRDPVRQAVGPGLVLVRPNLLRQYGFPDAAMEDEHLGLLLADLARSKGGKLEQLPASVLSRIASSVTRWAFRPPGEVSPAPQPAQPQMPVRELLDTARQYWRTGQYDQAQAACDQVLRSDPNNPAALHILGMVLHRSGQSIQGLELVNRSIQLTNDVPEFHSNRGNILAALDRHAEAVEAFQKAITLKPDYPEALNNVGLALLKLGRVQEASESLFRATQLRPDFAMAWTHRAQVQAKLGQFDEAIDSARKACTLAPDLTEVHLQLANLLNETGRLDEADTVWTECAQRYPDNADLRLQRAMFMLSCGDFARGWPEYEHRLKTPNASPLDLPDVPRWKGENLAGKRLLVRCEQGLGAAIQFVRFALLLADQAEATILECQAPLAKLLTGCHPRIEVIPGGSPLPKVDFTIPLMSIPGALGTTLATVPAHTPYLSAQPERTALWTERLAKVPGRKIGITWQGNPRFGGDPFRSLSANHFAPLAAIPGISLISLQKVNGEHQLQAAKFRVADLGPQLDGDGPFLDTAAIMMNLDMVITSDTSIAHLAGALARPTWVALNNHADWRWLRQREDCPWYSTMRLFRQQRPGDWPGTFQRIAAELRSHWPC